MKRILSLSLFTLLVGTSFAACSHPAGSTTFQGHDAYVPPDVSHTASPSDLSPYQCSAAWDCDFWVCTCADGNIVAAAVCDSGYCLLADAACQLGCDFFGDGGFSGSADGGPGSGIGKPDDPNGGAGGGGGGGCTDDGGTCYADDECCSGVCDPVSRSCTVQCAIDGDACSSDDECCNGVCNASGYCGDMCAAAGDFCTSDVECCSATCNADGTCG
jgi:hypothetical protein